MRTSRLILVDFYPLKSSPCPNSKHFFVGCSLKAQPSRTVLSPAAPPSSPFAQGQCCWQAWSCLTPSTCTEAKKLFAEGKLCVACFIIHLARGWLQFGLQTSNVQMKDVSCWGEETSHLMRKLETDIFFSIDPREIAPCAHVALAKGDLDLETAHQKALDCTELTASNYVGIYPTEWWKITLLPSLLLPEEYMPRKKGVGLKDSRAKETASNEQYSSNKLAHRPWNAAHSNLYNISHIWIYLFTHNNSYCCYLKNLSVHFSKW